MNRGAASAGTAGETGSDAATPGKKLQASGRDVRPDDASASAPAYLDMEFDDFEAQAERLAGHDQEYVKLSTEPFGGRFASAFPGRGVSVHQETVNCAMHQRVSCPGDMIGLGVSLGPRRVVVNGIRMDRDDVLVTRPGSELKLDVPREGAEFMVIAVELWFLESLAGTVAGSEHFDLVSCQPCYVV